MTATLHITTSDNRANALHLVSTAVEHEIARLEWSLRVANRKLSPFEAKYGVSSEYFYENMAAEDLEGADDEYICWAGEYELRERLKERLEQMRSLVYEY